MGMTNLLNHRRQQELEYNSDGNDYLEASNPTRMNQSNFLLQKLTT